MARSFSNVKALSAFVANEISAFSSRRGFAAAAQGSVSSAPKTGAPNMMLKKGSEETAKSAWAPDPVTGYYRPEGKANEIDAAELRALLLKNKPRSQ